jgi:hypothetical protein
MVGVKRALGLPKQPIVIITGTGRRNSRTHIVRAGFTYSRNAVSASTAEEPKAPSAT